jgi:hypothetical protein
MTVSPVVITSVDQVEVKWLNGAPIQVFIQWLTNVTDSNNNNMALAQSCNRQVYQANDPAVASIVAAAVAAVAQLPVPE